jgi:hypothetical protein
MPRPDSPADPRWQEFRLAHETWLARLPAGAPVYRLPRQAIGMLESASRIDRRGADCERALTRLCKRAGAVGFWDGEPISYPDLRKVPPRGYCATTGMLVPAMTHDRPRRPRAKEGAEIFERVKGYAGWLITDPAFLEAARGLEELRRAGPVEGRARFPLRRDLFLSRPREGLDAAAGAEGGREFAADFVAFCDRWAPVGMASWELPEPQGPLLLSRPMPGRMSPGASCTSSCRPTTQCSGATTWFARSASGSKDSRRRQGSIPARPACPTSSSTPGSWSLPTSNMSSPRATARRIDPRDSSRA